MIPGWVADICVASPFIAFIVWFVTTEIRTERRHSRSRAEYDSRRETLDRIQRVPHAADKAWLMAHHWLSLGEEDNAERMLKEARRCAEAAQT